MSNTILEMIRSKNEELEHLEKALTKAISYKENNVFNIIIILLDPFYLNRCFNFNKFFKIFILAKRKSIC